MFNLENFGIDVKVDVSKTTLPFYFKRKNECVKCGSVNSLVFIDKFGRESKDEIRAFDHIKCKNCGRVYGIKWEKDESSNKMYPSATDLNISQEFKNLINFNIKDNGVKELD